MEFKYFLKEKMIEKKIGVNELARQSGLSSAQISRLLSGDRSLTFKSAIQLAPVLDISAIEQMKIAGYAVQGYTANVAETPANYPSKQAISDPDLKMLKEAWEKGEPEIRSALKNILKQYKANQNKK